LSGFREEKHRKIIPRWRLSRKTVMLGELAPVSAVDSVVALEKPDDFETKLREWRVAPGLGSALELVGAAAVLDRGQDAADAAALVESSELASSAAKQLARVVAGQGVDIASSGKLSPALAHDLRANLRSHPRNALAWVDLALHHTNEGDLEKAERAMRVAVGLEPSNRFVVRAAARLLVHAEQAEKAYGILSRCPAAATDPWLMACEISLASLRGRTSDLVRSARELLKSNNVSPFHLSELASSLATLETENGSMKNARKLFRQSLVRPTENSVAQASWAAHAHHVIELDPAYLRGGDTFEAQALSHFHSGSWETCLAASQNWLNDQSFSPIPAALASYVASSALKDFPRAKDVALSGLRANPQNPWLLNNLAFAQANLGSLDEAWTSVSEIKATDDTTKVLRLATQGLIRFRAGDIEAGRRYYRDALEAAKRAALARLYAKAAIFFALEETRIQSEFAPEARNLAEKLTKDFVDADIAMLRSRLRTGGT
jgi:tetratricopeptide (TPR) repeat protein